MALHALKIFHQKSQLAVLLGVARPAVCLSGQKTCSTWNSHDRCVILKNQYANNNPCQLRLYSTQSSTNQPTKFWKYILGEFSKVIGRYTERLEKKQSPVFRRVVDVVRLIKCVKYVALDTKTYIKVAGEFWLGKEFESFTRKELDIYHQMPKDILKLLPLLLLTTIPIVGNTFFIIGYYFPQRFLTHQFWTAQQKEQFFQTAHKKKCAEYKHILTYMDKQVHKHMTGEGREKMLDILKKVEMGSEPTIEELLGVKEYFESFPFCIDSLPSPYFRKLVKACDMSTRRFPLLMYGMLFYIKQRRTPLQEDGYLLLHTDQVILREGLDSLTNEEIYTACFRRGLNPYGLTKEEQLSYLDKWTRLSCSLTENSISLLLHAQVLFTYNSPTNVKIMKGSKYRWKR